MTTCGIKYSKGGWNRSQTQTVHELRKKNSLINYVYLKMLIKMRMNEFYCLRKKFDNHDFFLVDLDVAASC